MQVFGNVATEPVSKESKLGKVYAEFRLAEGHKNLPGEVTWYSVRCMHARPLNLSKGDFVKVTGRLKVDSYLSREGKPTSTLLVIAFEASKIAKPATTSVANGPVVAAPASLAAKAGATATPEAVEAMDWC